MVDTTVHKCFYSVIILIWFWVNQWMFWVFFSGNAFWVLKLIQLLHIIILLRIGNYDTKNSWLWLTPPLSLNVQQHPIHIFTLKRSGNPLWSYCSRTGALGFGTHLGTKHQNWLFKNIIVCHTLSTLCLAMHLVVNFKNSTKIVHLNKHIQFEILNTS